MQAHAERTVLLSQSSSRSKGCTLQEEFIALSEPPTAIAAHGRQRLRAFNLRGLVLVGLMVLTVAAAAAAAIHTAKDGDPRSADMVASPAKKPVGE